MSLPVEMNQKDMAQFSFFDADEFLYKYLTSLSELGNKSDEAMKR
jgi:hypothetical protein